MRIFWFAANASRLKSQRGSTGVAQVNRPFRGMLLSSVIEEYDYARKRKPSCNCRHTKPLEQGQANWSQAGIDMWRKAAGYVDRILKGEKPADMPVQAPTKHQLVINLTTAKALGLDVPMHLQQIADEIIE